MTGAWRYVTIRCRRVWRWFAVVSRPEHVARAIGCVAAVGLPLAIGPTQFAPGWSPYVPALAAPLPQPSGREWAGAWGIGPQTGAVQQRVPAAGGYPAHSFGGPAIWQPVPFQLPPNTQYAAPAPQPIPIAEPASVAVLLVGVVAGAIGRRRA